MSATILPYRRTQRNRNTARTTNDIRREIDGHFEALVVRHQMYLQIRAEIEDGGFEGVKTNTLDVLDILIDDDHADLQRKINLYKRFQGHPYAATVPDTTSDRYQALLNTASDLRMLWSAERFATEVLGVQLERRGGRLVGLCPFHQENTPSFTVYPETDTFWCFGCFQRGDGIDIFAMIGRWQNLVGFRHQVEWLASFSHAWFGGDSA
jgi:hypothetical protein